MQLRRTTFHDFMLDVHSRLHQQERTSDPLTLVAAELVSEFKVLCLDEFFVTDVADATMLKPAVQPDVGAGPGLCCHLQQVQSPQRTSPFSTSRWLVV